MASIVLEPSVGSLSRAGIISLIEERPSRIEEPVTVDDRREDPMRLNIRSRALRLLVFGLATAAFMAASPQPSTSAEKDDQLARRIQEQIAADTRLTGVKVKVASTDGEVVLLGSVRLYRQKIVIEQIAWRTPGSVEVDNELHVVPAVPVADAEVERRIETATKTLPRFHGAGLKVEVERGRVTIHGTFRDPADVMLLRHLVADMEGVIGLAVEATLVA